MTSLPIGRWGSVALLLAGLACLGSASTGQASLSAADATSHLTALLAGVETIVGPGSPGGVVAFGAKAFPVVAGGQGPRDAVVAAAEWERGRVVILGHTGYLDPANFGVRDTATFLRNLLFWTGNKSKPRVLVLGNNALVDWLQQQGLTAAAGQPRGWANQLAGVDVLIGKENEFSSPEHRTAAERFARRGGGLILASTGWGWLQLNPGKNLSRDHPGNRLLVRAGLAWSGQFVGKTDRDGFKTAPVPETMLHAGRALDAFEKQSQLSADERRQAQHTLSATIAVLPAGEPIIVTRMRELRRRHGDAVIPTAKKPIRSDDGLKRLLVAWDVHQLLALPVEEIKAHPAAAEFPGSVPPAARPETRTLTVDTSIPGWHSTGLYAVPGQPITVTVAPAAAALGLSVRIGSHSDSNWHHDRWQRLPEVCRVWPISAARTRAANGLGGLVYMVVPDRGVEPGRFDVKIEGAVPAPFFVLGETSEEEWISRLSKLPGPWAELATSKLIITVPSRVVRELRNPVELMQAWDRVMDACAELKRVPAERRRPERFVLDEQISAGYMHSGYPLMAHLDVERTIVDAAKVAGGQDMWGFYHEIGHNHQEPEWTFDGTTEVTVNLFTMYAHEKVAGRADMGTELTTPAKLQEKIKPYFGRGAKFEEWKSDPFLALCMYIQLQQAFGWQAYQDVFEEYRKLPRHERPRSDDEKRDQWLVRFSLRVGKNLGPFFEAWGVPTSAEARGKVAHLPLWMPPDFPPQ